MRRVRQAIKEHVDGGDLAVLRHHHVGAGVGWRFARRAGDPLGAGYIARQYLDGAMIS